MRFVIVLLALASTSAWAGGTPVLTEIVSGLSSPLAVRNAGDGSNRLFIVQQGGLVRLFQSNMLEALPFVDVTTLTNGSGERGLLGLAFHPNFSVNGRFYLNYTNNSGDTVIAQCTVDGNPDVVDCLPDNDGTDGDVILLTIDQDFGNHNGGDLHFGRDGYLYVGMGDGGSAGDPNDRSQDPRSLLGKMLRIDVDNPGGNVVDACGGGVNYGIPPDNPFLGADTGNVCDEVWSVGMRNPYRFSFDRDTGDLWIGDVGQNRVEEIDLEPFISDDDDVVYLGGFENRGGTNFGWDCREGSTEYDETGSDPDTPAPECDTVTGLVDPVMEYNHASGRCSINGGFRYRGAIADYMGSYFFGDYCSGEIFRGDKVGGNWTFVPFIDPGTDPSTYCPSNGFCQSGFGEDEAGELYVVDIGGRVFRLDFTP